MISTVKKIAAVSVFAVCQGAFCALSIADFGAKDGLFNVDVDANTAAIGKAVDSCASNLLGEVIVPKGLWLTGPIHLKSNVHLRLDDGAFLIFEDDPKKYLPVVKTSWEGVECMNYSPLVYAYGCTNVGIVGKGTLAPKMAKWRDWFVGGEIHKRIRAEVFAQMMRGEEIEKRVLAERGGYFRPHLIQFNRCRNVVLKDFRIRESPFWTIHLLRCDGVNISKLDSRALGHNSDGINLEKTKNVVVRDCKLHQGDDGVVIKAGRNRDGWDGDSLSCNIDIKGVKLIEGHGLLVLGSELSGGIENVTMRNSLQIGASFALFSLKTNPRRGGHVKNILMENCFSHTVRDIVSVRTDSSAYPYPVDELRRTQIDGITIRNCSVGKTSSICSVKGDKSCPVANLRLERVTAGVALTNEVDSSLCPNFSSVDVRVNKVDPVEAQWSWDVPKPWYAIYDMPAYLPDAAALENIGEVGDFRLSFDFKATSPDAALSLRSSHSVKLAGLVGATAFSKPLYDAYDPSKEFQHIEVIVHRGAISVAVNGYEVICNEIVGGGFPSKGALAVKGAQISNVVLELILGQKY